MKAKKILIRLSLPFLLFVWLSDPGLSSQGDDKAREIVRAMEKRFRGNTSAGRMGIIVKRPRFTRKLLLDSWEDTKKDFSFIRILKPEKDRGVTFLKRGKNLWQYIPGIGREIKIEGSLMHDSWMGSDFTNDDLVRSSSTVDDYFHKFLAAPSDKVYRIELIPRPEAIVVWGKVILDIRKEDSLPVLQKFYDHRGRLKKNLIFGNYKNMGGRLIPTRMEMQTIRSGRVASTTTMLYIKVRFDKKIPAHIFSKSNLRK